MLRDRSKQRSTGGFTVIELVFAIAALTIVTWANVSLARLMGGSLLASSVVLVVVYVIVMLPFAAAKRVKEYRAADNSGDDR